MKKDMRVAVVACQSMVGRTEENLLKMAAWTRSAVAQHADIVCFPEACITGYHVREPILEEALPIDDRAVKTVMRMAVKHEIAIIAGLAERGKNGGIYSTGFACDQNGMVNTYRKVHLGPPEDQIFTPADKIGSPFEINGFKFGIQLCYDAHFPELSTHMAALGADAIFMLHASPGGSPREKKDSWMRHLPARAFDNGLFVIAVNPAGDNGHGLNFPGTAIALSPAGKIIADYTAEKEGMLIADLTKEMLEDVRGHRMRYFFSRRRPELYGKKS